ncbi:hypothetical protein [Methylocapsa sp. S129]|uniref:hypothetical protein n=1 Tax=Methylocapsa sp. S129 TaxID=1641869 RepID=UPI001AEDCD54|nr:hypothetical protein [Methylocapsa sp. S129]
MALSAVQAALARLFTDEAARAAFLRDPQGAGRSLGLDEGEANMLAAIAPKALRQFAGGLKAKRALDARKAMPLTAKALGEAFGRHFRAAAQSAPAGASRVREARALAMRLAALAHERKFEPKWAGDLARYEAAFVEAAHRRFGLRLLWFGYPVGAIAASLHAGAPVSAIAPATTLGLWARRPGGRLFHRLWSLTR